MKQATWNGAVIAQSERCEVVERNQYFPAPDVKHEYLRESTTKTVCGWKGTAGYFDVIVDGKTNKDAAWYYPDPKAAAQNIKGHIAFWKGITVS
jgi:uncharacterized protein (DUF427 family)